MNKTIIGICILLIVITGCSNATPNEDSVKMSCNELINELDNSPHIYIRDNELYTANVIKIMKLKGCTLE